MLSDIYMLGQTKVILSDTLNVKEDDHFSGGSVMVWTEIHHDGCTALVAVNGTLNAQIYGMRCCNSTLLN